MAWTWIRPADPDVLSGRPLLDVGVGDGQTLRALLEPRGLVVGMDGSSDAVRAARRAGVCPLVRGLAEALPFRDGSLRVVLAADLFHHLDDAAMGRVLADVCRALVEGGRLVAWWYQAAGRPGPDSPRHPRQYRRLEEAALVAGFRETAPLELVHSVHPSPPTAGLVTIA